ncbi:MMPL family transporter [Dactylosporangium sp. NPDC049525]|uniref:MMPL family transporter n=1 Tax=Dactylosporangium sp. NPDC049525 TaxID=3154730 RepID=UPI00341EF348
MTRIARFAERYARWIFAVSLILVVVGGLAATRLTDHLTQSFSLPGQKGYETNQRIVMEYGGGGQAPPTVIVVKVPAEHRITDRATVDSLSRGADALSAAGPASMRVASYGGPDDKALLAADGRTTFVLAFPPPVGGIDGSGLGQSAADEFVRAAGLPAGTQAYTTGIDALSESGGGEASVVTETAIGAAGALIILIFVFGSFLAIVPLLVAAVSILTTLLLVLGLTAFTEVSFIVEFLVALIGLGIAIDYSLIIVTRWREERARGRSNADAVSEAVRTAGHAVIFSGVTVAVGLLALVALPVPFLRSVGYGGVLIPLVSIAVNLTLLPALLVKAGPFLDRPRRKAGANASAPSRLWTGWARTVVRRRWWAAAVGLAMLGLLLVPASSLRVGDPDTAALASSGPATVGLRTLQAAGIESGVLTPIEVVAESANADEVESRIAALPGIHGVVVTGQKNDSVILDALPTAETSSAAGKQVLDRLTEAVEPLGASVGGVGANSEAFNNAIYGSFPLMLAIIVVVTFLLLVRAFRSVLLPLKAVALNLLSVGATYGLLVLVWQDGYGSDLIWGIQATGAITNFVPLMVFAYLFGLSMDYEVFILARMREEYDATQDTNHAVIAGIGYTGRLVTSAALILFLAFSSLSQASEVAIKVFATGLGAGILLDATVVRALLVPALVSLFGRANWVLPRWLARILFIRDEPYRDANRLDHPAAAVAGKR